MNEKSGGIEVRKPLMLIATADPGIDRRIFLKGAGALSATTIFLGTNSVPVLSQTRKEETPEFQGALEEVVSLLSAAYAANIPTTLEGALARQRDIEKKIFEVFEKNRLSISAGRDTTQQMMNLFRTYGYILAVSPLAVGQGKFVVNAPLYKIDTVSESDLLMFQFPDLPSVDERVPINSVVNTLVSDVRETSRSPVPRMIFSGMTVANEKGEATVLIFEEKVRTIAQRDALNAEHYRKTVVANELSQVYLIRVFARDFPDAGFLLGLPLSTFGIDTRGKEWTVQHLQEAFSDWGSLKYGGTFAHELVRILRSPAAHYAFSNAIAAAAVQLVARDPRFVALREGVTIDRIHTFPPNYQRELKAVILENYEANLKLALTTIRRQLPMVWRIYREQKQKR